MQQQGLEAVIHVSCRDRNRIAIQGELLSAHVLGIQNLIVVHSDEMTYGDHIDAKAVEDLNEVELLEVIRSLQKGVDMAGFDLKGQPQFTVGCTLRPYADDAGLEAEAAAVGKKVEAGAQYVITPPVFDLERFARLADKIGDLGVPLIPTVFLLKSVGTARYIATTEPAAGVSEEMIRRIRKAPDRVRECILIAGELVAGFKEMAQGVKIETLGWEHSIPDIMEAAGI